jgi:hypothetical protein
MRPVLNANGAPQFDAAETWNILESPPLRISVFAFDPDNRDPCDLSVCVLHAPCPVLQAYWAIKARVKSRGQGQITGSGLSLLDPCAAFGWTAFGWFDARRLAHLGL